jgi:hypothetical protein
MRTFCLVCYLIVALGGGTWAQDHYIPSKALSSEELFLKEHQTQKIFTRAGERYLAVDATNFFGSFHRYRFFPGETIRFRTVGASTPYNEEIYSVTDSSFTFVFINEAAGRLETREILLKSIRKVKTFRRIPWVTDGAVLLPLAGLVYIGADFFNKGIDGQRFTTDIQTMAVGGGLMLTGLICYKLSFSSLRINRHNRLKVLKTY